MEMTKVVNPEMELRKFIRFDKHRELLSFLQNQLKVHSEDKGKILLSPKLWKLICSHRAVNCASTLLDQEIFYWMNPNIALGDGLYPLHLAAQILCYELTELFIVSRAQPDGFCENDLAKLPLSLALEAICCNECVRDWSPQKSIFKLFYIFSLSELKEPLDTVRLLASKTNHLQEITVRCILNKDIVHFVALLLVAWDKLMPPAADQSIKDSFVGQLILDELEVLEHQEKKLLGHNCASLLPPLHEHKSILESAWKAIKILEMSQGLFLEYLRLEDVPDAQPHQVPFNIAQHLWLPLNIPIQPEDLYSDDVKCLRPRLKPRQKAWLKHRVEQQKRMISAVPRASEGHASKTVSNSRSFHTCRAFDVNLVKPVGKQLTRSTRVASVSLANFSSSVKLLGLVVSAAKKYVK